MFIHGWATCHAKGKGISPPVSTAACPWVHRTTPHTPHQPYLISTQGQCSHAATDMLSVQHLDDQAATVMWLASWCTHSTVHACIGEGLRTYTIVF
eukprot:1239082-Prymnesium_polylepis.1